LLSAYSSGATSYYEPDALGSTDALLNDAGSISDRYAYRAFGLSLLPPGPTANDFQFVGRKGYFKDPEISFYFLNNRYLDFATGRFVSEDPSGYKGGDANLYRYVGNNPVNQVDPSGLAILLDPSLTYDRRVKIRVEKGSLEWLDLVQEGDTQALAQGFYYIVAKVSGASGRLRDDIFQQLGPWENNYWNNAGDRDLFSIQRLTVHNQDWNKIELLRYLPPTFWKHVQDNCCSRVLARNIYDSLKEDDQIRLGGNGQLDWYEITAPDPSILGQLWKVLQEVTSSVISNVSRLSLQSVRTLLQVGFVAFLRAANIDAGQFEAAIEKFSGFANLLWKIAQDPLTFAKNLAEGAERGFRRFARGFPDNAKTIAIEWLFGKLEAFRRIWNDVRRDLPTDFTLESMGLFLLKVAGLTYDKIRATLRGLGYENLDRAIDYLKGKLGNPAPTYSMTKDRIADFNAATPSLQQFNFNDIKTQLLDSLPGLIATWALNAFVSLATMVVFPSAGALAGIWKTVKWAAENWRAIGAFAQTVQEALEKALNDPAGVANKVVQGLTSLTKLVLDLIARFLKVDPFIGSISALVTRVLSWLPNKVIQLIIWLLGLVGIRPRSGGACMMGSGGRGAGGMCFAWETLTLTADGPRHLGGIQVGWLLPPLKPWQKTSESTGPLLERDEAKLRVVRCRLDKEPGLWVDITLLRPVEWIEERQVRVGGKFPFRLPEMGVVGEPVVQAVDPCQTLPQGAGRLVTATFRHSWGELYDLLVEGEGKPIKVTFTHPFWSPDRKKWVSAGELEIGERLLAENGGSPRVMSLTKRLKPEQVCNIEVEGDHCYRVGEGGLLVHNASVPCENLDKNKPDLKQRERVRTINVTILPVGTPTTPRTEAVVRQTVAWVRFEPFKGQFVQPDAQYWVWNVVGRPRLVFRGVDDTGHVIARELGGQGDLSEPLNIVPLHPFVNTGSYMQAEKIAIDAAKQGSCAVCVRVKFNYDRTSSYPGRPTMFTYEVWLDGNKIGNASDRNILSLPGR
jgi:RHS repeat-associated protein